MDALAYTIIIVISVLLLICFIKIIANSFISSNNNLSHVITLVPIKNHNENVEYTVRSIIWSENWGKLMGQHILLVLIDCDEETYKMCSMLCKEYKCVSYCKPNELQKIINNPSLLFDCIA